MHSWPPGGAKKRAVKLTGDSKVFEEGQLGEAPGGGSLTTYRELSALATEMGQPDLLYKFMDLANHATTMASTRGAAFGYASLFNKYLICRGPLILHSRTSPFQRTGTRLLSLPYSH